MKEETRLHAFMGICIALTMLIPAAAIFDFYAVMPLEMLAFFVAVLWFGLWLNMRRRATPSRLKWRRVLVVATLGFCFGFTCGWLDLFINGVIQ